MPKQLPKAGKKREIEVHLHQAGQRKTSLHPKMNKDLEVDLDHTNIEVNSQFQPTLFGLEVTSERERGGQETQLALDPPEPIDEYQRRTAMQAPRLAAAER